jgi:hypothetical protein
MMEHALAYARMGWAVFPLSPGMKIPIAGSRGFKDATSDLAVITAWWTATPNANIGIATGKASGFWVIDSDNKKGKDGEASLKVFAAQHAEPPAATKVVQTPTGGTHRYIAYDERAPVRNRANVLVGVDIRGDGGYVVAPPSITEIGAYTWASGADDTPIAEASSWYAALPTHNAQRQHAAGQGQPLKREPSRRLPWDLAIDAQHQGSLTLDATTVGQKYVCRCPFHGDGTRSAFFLRKTPSYGFLFCSACDVSWATEEKPTPLTNRIAAISARLQEIEELRNGKQR